MADTVLVLNAGSSSLKFSLYREDKEGVFTLNFRGLLEGIGSNPYLKSVDISGKILIEKKWDDPSFASADARDALLGETIEWISHQVGNDRIIAVGHRVVHGGLKYSSPVIVNNDILHYLDSLTPFVPLHQPASLPPIRVMMEKLPNVPQIACFDTAFHATMPDKAKRFALPREYDDLGVRRYGFHGLSYEYIVHHLQQTKSPLATGKVVVAHLGNGASLSAIKDGKCVETTMSFTPLDGLVMGTRTGHIDASIVLYMLQEQKLTPKEIETVLWKKSGLLGVSGVSNDMRDIQREVETKGKNAISAQQALNLFAYRLITEIGRMCAALEGVDGLIFTAGIGEHDAQLRSEVCSSLSWLGIEIDEQANKAHQELISTSNSKVIVQVIPTNEEAMMLKHILKLAKN